MQKEIAEIAMVPVPPSRKHALPFARDGEACSNGRECVAAFKGISVWAGGACP